MKLENSLFENRSKHKYIIFLLGSELYGAPLLEVREVIENKITKPIPDAVPAFEGILNLRGEVIGVLDLRKLLKITPKQSLSILVFDSPKGAMGAIVDRCLSVAEIADKDIEKLGGVSQASGGGNYFIGVGKSDTGLITLINLPAIVPEQVQNVGR
jgi:purine-binding chemotaxis protein CheW